MQRYTLLTIKNERIAGSVSVEASCDVNATELAWTLAGDENCELWSGERLVAFIERSARTTGQTAARSSVQAAIDAARYSSLRNAG